jgi:hypothetical protein
MQQKVSRVPYKGEHTRGQWSTEQDSVLGIKLGLRDTDVCSRVIYRGRSESEAGYER